jgi:hypothetical protein
MMAQVTSRPAAFATAGDRARVRPATGRRGARDGGAHMSAGHLSRQFRLAHGESP